MTTKISPALPTMTRVTGKSCLKPWPPISSGQHNLDMAEARDRVSR
jgi:hypothetical protein